MKPVKEGGGGHRVVFQGSGRISSIPFTLSGLAALVLVILTGSFSGVLEGKKGEQSPQKAAEERPSETFAEKQLREIVEKQESIFARIKEKGGGYHEGDLEEKMGTIIHQYEEYINNNPSDVLAYVFYGKLLVKVGQEEAAVLQFLSADKIDPKIAVVKQQLGNYMAEHGKYEEALGFFLQAIQLSPKTALYYYQIGEVMNTFRDNIILDGLYERGELDRSMQEAFSKAAELAPENRAFQFRYAESFYDVENPAWEKALALWETLQEGAPAGMERESIILHRANILADLGRDEEAHELAEKVDLPELRMSRRQVLDKAAGQRTARDSESGGVDAGVK